MSEKIVTAAFVVIGDEILSGRTRDENINFLAVGLGELGIRLSEVRVIPDDEAAIIEAVNFLRQKYNYVFTSGGIGPTHDDITALSIAKAFGDQLIKNPEAVDALMQHHSDIDVNEAYLKMALIPSRAQLLDNSISSAPGFYLENVFVMAGVPKIFQVMFEAAKKEMIGGKKVKSYEIKIDLVESVIAKDLSKLQNDYPEISMGSYPFSNDSKKAKSDFKRGTSLVFRGTDEKLIEQSVNEMVALLREIKDGLEIIITSD